MAEASKTVEMSVPLDKLWKVINDFERYKEFVDGVQKVEILKREGKRARVKYAIELLGKEVSYTLDHEELGPGEMSWSLVESNILKSNAGGWKLKSRGEALTEVTYSLALEFKIYVPGMILNGLVKSTLPKMLDGFEKRTKSL